MDQLMKDIKKNNADRKHIEKRLKTTDRRIKKVINTPSNSLEEDASLYESEVHLRFERKALRKELLDNIIKGNELLDNLLKEAKEDK